jgi:hypothetical protein
MHTCTRTHEQTEQDSCLLFAPLSLGNAHMYLHIETDTYMYTFKEIHVYMLHIVFTHRDRYIHVYIQRDTYIHATYTYIHATCFVTLPSA